MSKKVNIIIKMLCLTVILSSCSNNKYQMVDIYVEHTVKDVDYQGDNLTENEDDASEKKQSDIDIIDTYYIESFEAFEPLEEDDYKVLEVFESLEESIAASDSIDEASFSFFKQEISEAIFLRIQGLSYAEGCTIPLSELCYIKVLHYGFDGEVHEGELIVNVLIADEIVEIFKELFEAKYPIEKMKLIDEYNADDDLSMEDNNTSCFNYRTVQGTDTLSNHSYGMAIDINPLYNPYIKEKNKEKIILPKNAANYTDRDLSCEYYIKKDDVCYNAFIKRGFIWGGEWQSVKDYQHFERR